MKAIVCNRYGKPDVLELKDVEKPIPKDNEVLVKVRASSVNTQNLVFVSGKPYFVRLMGAALRKPAIRIPGNDMTGQVESVGRKVKQFQPGNEVFGDLSVCGHGAFAEYICAPGDALALKPANATFEETAGACEAALVALQGLRDKGNIQKGQKVLIYGASGGIGSFAVQIAKYFGAEVTGVCSARNLEMVRSLGADHVIDYAKEDFSRNGRSYDLIFAIASRSIFDHMRALAPKGKYVSTGSPSMVRIFQDLLLGPLLSRKKGKGVISGWTVKPNQRDLAFIKELFEAGRIRSVIDRCYPLHDAPKALRYYLEGHSRGKVIITLDGPEGGKR